MPPVPLAASSVVAHETPGRAEVLDADDHVRRVELQAALDEQLLHERVADLHGGPLGLRLVLEGRRGEHGRAADAVGAGRGAEQHDLVARPRRGGQLDLVLCAAGRRRAR